MIIVGDNLEQLIAQHNIVKQSGTNRANPYDNTCICLTLGDKTIRFLPKENFTLAYEDNIPEDCLSRETIGNEGVIIPPLSAILACSHEKITMPLGYFGLVQTKGSLARMLVSIHFSDGQIDPGYSGVVTFEIFNASPYNIQLFKKQSVANLYIFKASNKKHQPYAGRYQNAEGPTWPIFE